MIEIFLLEQLVTFSRCGTLSRAAEELHITQPALSRSMKKLENEFGVSLFYREKSKICLNETGKIATEYAKKVLDANCEMIEKTVQFDRSMHTINVGTCAFLPVHTLIPVLQKQFEQKSVTFEIADDTKLISGLKNRTYQLAVLHTRPNDPSIFYQKYFDEHLYISVPKTHPLASHKEVSFADLSGMSILAHSNSGFWIDICKENLKDSKLLLQDSIDALHEIIDYSSLPAFHSDRAVEYGYTADDRIVIPVNDKAAHVTYYLACLGSDVSFFGTIWRSKE